MAHAEHSPRLQAVLFDWAGTTIDFGSRAPVEVVREVFKRRGVEVMVAEVRGPMGRAKRDHLAAVLAMPRVAAAWEQAHGRHPIEADVDQLYADFLPLQREVLSRHCDVLPGVPEAVAECRRRGLKIGSTTGYTRELMEVVLPLARAGGYAPDVALAADDAPAGRPAPWLNFRAAERLGVYPLSTVVVVDDTPVGIAAGRNAGAWTVAVTATGNALGLSAAEYAALAVPQREALLAPARADFLAHGAHYAIDGVADLPGVLDEVEARLARGERP